MSDAGKGPEWRPHSPTAFADRYSRINWSTKPKPEPANDSNPTAIVVCHCGEVHRVYLEKERRVRDANGYSVCGKCLTRLIL